MGDTLRKGVKENPQFHLTHNGTLQMCLWHTQKPPPSLTRPTDPWKQIRFVTASWRHSSPCYSLMRHHGSWRLRLDPSLQLPFVNKAATLKAEDSPLPNSARHSRSLHLPEAKSSFTTMSRLPALLTPLPLHRNTIKGPKEDH